uniref:Endonuclease n=1 Tax=Pithovirus LCPAC401 TaxID=2506595 RepID=A0A481ZAZ4_9VIRU|nr:MAG: endonuclease [Pithovirus LCPAC401]
MKCFIELFPNDERTKKVNIPTKEYKVKDYLTNEFPGMFIHNKSPILPNKSHKKRIDFQTEVNSYMLYIEVDEYQHKKYDPLDEKERTRQIQEDIGRNVIFIRFNPDNYKEGGKMKKIPLDERYPVLKAKINEVIEKIENGDGYSDLITEFKLFYDDVNIPIKERSGLKCEGITREGKICKKHPIKDAKFCNHHIKIKSSNEEINLTKEVKLILRCIGITKKKIRCKNTPIKDTKTCRYH